VCVTMSRRALVPNPASNPYDRECSRSGNYGCDRANRFVSQLLTLAPFKPLELREEPACMELISQFAIARNRPVMAS
jgi:hypothetical protein